MKCPTCGEAELESKKGEEHFRGLKFANCEWKECPKCGETLHSAAEIKLMEKRWRESNLPESSEHITSVSTSAEFIRAGEKLMAEEQKKRDRK